MENHKRPSATVLFIFGGSGDLNFRKLSPALFNLFIDNWMPEKFSIIGIGRTDYSDVDYRVRLLGGIKQFSRRKDIPSFLNWFKKKLLNTGNIRTSFSTWPLHPSWFLISQKNWEKKKFPTIK